MLILETIASSGNSLEQAAVAMAGNYKKWRGYVPTCEDVPGFETLMIGYLVNNERTLRQLTNLEAVTNALTPYLGDPSLDGNALASIYKQDFCGDKDLLTGLMVQVYDSNNQITPAFKAVYELAKKLEESEDGIIDQALYETVNRRMLLGYVSGELPYICTELGIDHNTELVLDVVSHLIGMDVTYDDVDTDNIKEALCDISL